MKTIINDFCDFLEEEEIKFIRLVSCSETQLKKIFTKNHNEIGEVLIILKK